MEYTDKLEDENQQLGEENLKPCLWIQHWDWAPELLADFLPHNEVTVTHTTEFDLCLNLVVVGMFVL